MLHLENVSKIYGNRLIFKSVCLEAPAGKVLLLAGPNGAGKSTLLKIMAGLTAPDSGRVTLSLGDSGRIGYLGHQTFIYPQLSALENLRFWTRLHGLPSKGDAALMQALERVELAAFAHEKAGIFSRGMAQRLNLARVLPLAPDLLLLDEPGTGLDTRSRAMLDLEIFKARERGAAVVWITHSLREDLPKADLVAELAERGRLSGTEPAAPKIAVRRTAPGLVFFGPVCEYSEYAAQTPAGERPC